MSFSYFVRMVTDFESALFVDVVRARGSEAYKNVPVTCPRNVTNTVTITESL